MSLVHFSINFRTNFWKFFLSCDKASPHLSAPAPFPSSRGGGGSIPDTKPENENRRTNIKTSPKRDFINTHLLKLETVSWPTNAISIHKEILHPLKLTDFWLNFPTYFFLGKFIFIDPSTTSKVLKCSIVNESCWNRPCLVSTMGCRKDHLPFVSIKRRRRRAIS